MPTKRHALIALALVTVTACGGATPSTSPPPSSDASPSNAPSPSADATDGIEHPFGADAVVLRLEEGGGFMMVEWVATTAPIFTLYGDGTVIFRNPTDPMPESQDGFIRNNPFRIARLSEPQIQELLAFAINDGALGIAREKYENNLIADATTTSFTVQAAGKTKRVEVYALAEAAEDGPDAAVRNAFAELAAYLKDFEAQAEVAASDWQPTSYRGALIESAIGAPAEWPWPAIGVDDFEKPDDPNVFGLPTREMTVEEIAALGVADPEGGVHGIYLEGPDGKTYSFVIRPLLPDETA